MPYLPDARQYRSFAATNFQPIDRGEEQSYVVKGHFTTFESEYQLCGNFYEVIDRTALDNADMSDVVFQYDHRGDVLARQRNNSLRVGIDEQGGWCEADLSGCQRGRELYESIKNGLVVEMSFGFIIDDDGFEWEEDDEGVIHSRITKISKVFDVSAVSIPANPNTEISARAYLDGAIEAKRKQQEMLQRAEEERAADEQRRTAMRRRAAAALEMAALN